MMFDEIIDLFAGGGGWEVGLAWLGLEALGVELDDDACATRAAAGLSTLQADVAALDPLDFGGIRGLIASPPCQAWSRAGKRLGIVDQEHVFAVAQAMLAGVDIRDRTLPRLQDDRSLLVVEPLRWALALEPEWVALEQVPDVLPFWQLIEGALGSRGYSVWCGKVNAADYGVPQTRERAVLLASKTKRLRRPETTHADPRPGLPMGYLPWVSMAEALGWNVDDRVGFPRRNDTPSNKPTPGDDGEYRRRDRREAALPAQHVTEKARSWTRVLVNGNRPRAGRRTIDEPAPTMHFGHNAAAVRWVEIRRGGSRIEEGFDPSEEPAQAVTSRVDRWQGRSRPSSLRAGTNANDVERSVDQPAPTLRFGERLNTVPWQFERPATTVQGDPRIAQPGHKRESKDPDAPGRMEDAVRVTLEEAAILQSFPPDYPWAGRTKTSRFMQVGNAVPPLLALRMLEAVA